MKDSLGVVGGGFTDTYQVLQDRYQHWANIGRVCLIAGLGGFALYGLYKLTQKWLARIDKKEAEKIKELKSHQPGKLDKNATQCCFCLEAAATAVFAPCNHLAYCELCFRQLQKKHSGDHLKCPYCRTESKYQDVFFINMREKLTPRAVEVGNSRITPKPE